MKNIQRLLSGALFGGALVFAAAAATPAFAQDHGFCDEAGGKVYCCSTDANGKILSCASVGAPAAE